MKTLNRALLIAGVFALGAGALQAQEPGGSPPGTPRADDQPTGWEAFKARAAEAFDRLDSNHDGKIDKVDRKALRDMMMKRMAAEGDGPPPGADGAPPPPPPGADGPPPGGPGMGRMGGMGGRMGGMGGGLMLLRGADADKDGTITRAEFDGNVKTQFDAMDTNHDGTISVAERQAARAKMREEMRARMQSRSMNGGMGGHDMGGRDMDGPGGDGPPPPGE